MKVINMIFEILFSPFTLIFRTNVSKNPNKSVHTWMVFLIAVFITCLLLFLFYYKQLIV